MRKTPMAINIGPALSTALSTTLLMHDVETENGKVQVDVKYKEPTSHSRTATNQVGNTHGWFLAVTLGNIRHLDQQGESPIVPLTAMMSNIPFSPPL